MPKDGIINLIPECELDKDRITLETILKIEHYFSCSRNALLVRLKELKLISQVSVERFKVEIIKSAKKYGYDASLYRSGNEGVIVGDFGTLAKQLFDKEKISEGHYFDLMNSIGFDALNDSDIDEAH